MKFDLTITLGHLINLAAFLATLAFATWKILGRLREMEWKTDMIWKWYKKEHNINGDEK